MKKITLFTTSRFSKVLSKAFAVRATRFILGLFTFAIITAFVTANTSLGKTSLGKSYLNLMPFAGSGSIAWESDFGFSGTRANWQNDFPVTSDFSDGTTVTVSNDNANNSISEISVVNGFGFGNILEIEHKRGSIGGSTTSFAFSNPVRNLTFSMQDIDEIAGSFEDEIFVNAIRPDGSTIPITAANYGGTLGFHVAYTGNNRFLGINGNAGSGDTGGILDLTFPEEVVRIDFVYSNIDNNRGTSQRIGIANLSFNNAFDFDDDGDGVPNISDLDNDNDGIPDGEENICTPGAVPVGQTFANKADPGTQTGLFGFQDVTVDFNYELQGSATWADGVRTLNNGSLGADGSYINVQPRQTNFPNGSTAEYTLTFSKPVYKLEFKVGGIDNQDRLDVEATNNGVFEGARIVDVNLGGNAAISGNSIVSSAGGANAPSNSVLIEFGGPVTEVVLTAGKNNGNSGNVTMQIYDMEYCILEDSDGDGIPDYLDLDSDNDGIPDAFEAGHGQDGDSDGLVDGPFGGNGLSNLVETNDTDGASINYTIPNKDGDTDAQGNALADFKDKDADNDGITDAEEAWVNNATLGDPDNDGTIGGTSISDADGDGWDNTATAAWNGTVANSDYDAIPDHCDLDSDGDGLPDTFEGNFQVVDGDNDGIVGAGIPVDSDGDGLADSNDPDAPGNVIGGFGFNQDRDGDGIVNYLDLDVDNDGIIDNIEGLPTTSYVPPSNIDANNNGLDDAYDVTQGGVAHGYANTDGGSAPDYADTNADDQDGAGGDPNDLSENFFGPSGTLAGSETDNDNDGILDSGSIAAGDTDGDGIANVFDLNAGGNTSIANVTNGGQTPQSQPNDQNAGTTERDWRELVMPDNDGDGIPDSVDIDDDNDGVTDGREGCYEFTFTSVSANPGGTFQGSFNGEPFTLAVTNGTRSELFTDVDFTDTNAFEPAGTAPTAAVFNGAIEATLSFPNGPVNNLRLNLKGLNGTTLTFTEGGAARNLNIIISQPNFTSPTANSVGVPVLPGGSDESGTIEFLQPIQNLTISSNGNNADGFFFGGFSCEPIDTDGDGILDIFDLDSDNDGITDYREAGGTNDPDGSGQPGTGLITTNVDALGSPVVAGSSIRIIPEDFDGDGLNDLLDIDSDNDGIPDTIEAGGTDDNDDGRFGAGATNDVDADGLIDALDPIDNRDGSALNANSFLPVPNTDGTDGADYIDTEADGDGIFDIVEVLGATADTDGDGTIEGTTITDTDGDGWSNIVDSDDGGTAFAKANIDGDTYSAFGRDFTRYNFQDIDSDNDGIADEIETYDDFDSDGFPNAIDLDADNDGIYDLIENRLIPGQNGTDANMDGIAEGPDDGNGGVVDPFVEYNTFPTVGPSGERSYISWDSDGDGLPDNVEAQSTVGYISPIEDDPTTPDINEADTDGNGVNDAYDTNGSPITPVNTDGLSNDPQDYRDVDSDKDGLTDSQEALGLFGPFSGTDPNGSLDDPTTLQDTDNDVLTTGDVDYRDTTDDQPDNDNDGIPDSVDVDDDNDGILDTVEFADTVNTFNYNSLSDAGGSAFSATNGNPVKGLIVSPLSSNDTNYDVAENTDGIVRFENNTTTTGDFAENTFTFTDKAPIIIADPQSASFAGQQSNMSSSETVTFVALDPGPNFRWNILSQGATTTIVFSTTNSTNDTFTVSGGNPGDFADYNVSSTGNIGGVSVRIDIVNSVGAFDSTQFVICQSGRDSDDDGVFDQFDLDSDNDGLPDTVEAQTTAGFVAPSDTVNQQGFASPGLPDNFPVGGLTPVNTDGDGTTPDYLDLDSDNDGISDNIEADIALLNTDVNGNGLDDFMDGTLNTIMDAYAEPQGTLDDPSTLPEDDGNTSDVDYRSLPDIDMDGIPDAVDVDDDNDGITDVQEGLCTPSTTGAWSGSTPFGGSTPFTFNATTASGVDVAVSVTFDGNADNFASNSSGNFGANFYQSNDGPLNGASSAVLDLNWDGNAESPDTNIDAPGDDKGSGTITITFDKTVENPIIHLDRLGGTFFFSGTSQFLSNSIQLTLASPGTLNKLSGTDDFIVTSSSVRREAGIVVEDANPEADQSRTRGAAAGSILVAGVFDEIVFTWTGVGFEGNGGDAFEIIVEACELIDTDGDGIPDYTDLDSDNDGIPDNVEAQTTAGWTAPDTANVQQVGDPFPGLPYPVGTDPFDATLPNTDGTGSPDYLDTDSDGDGITDTEESGVTLSGSDTNGNGLDDAADEPSNNTAIYTTPQGNVTNPATDYTEADGNLTDVDYRTTPDFDGDGIGDLIDIDDDNDGILDIVEALAFDPANPASCIFPTPNFDATMVTLETDAGAGFEGDVYRFEDVVNIEGTNLDALITVVSATTNITTFTIDNDTPGQGDPNAWQPEYNVPAGETAQMTFNVRLVFEGTNTVFPLPRFAGTFNDIDGANANETITLQMPGVYVVDDATQLDIRDNETGGVEFQGPMSTFTGVDLRTDLAVYFAYFQQSEFNFTASAVNGTASPNTNFTSLSFDVCGVTRFATAGNDYDYVVRDGIDSDGDGFADEADIDSDNDGIPDNVEAQLTDPASYIAPTGADTDGDGLLDVFEGAGDEGLTPVDTDGDFVPDYLDTNSDNEGANDVIEAGYTPASTTTDTDGDGLLDAYDDNNATFDSNDDLDTGASTLPNVQNSGTPEVDYRDPTEDFDGDGIPDNVDEDDDNDGIPDVEEEMYCQPLPASGIIFAEDFGTGARTTNPFVSASYSYEPGTSAGGNGIFDGEYAIDDPDNLAANGSGSFWIDTEPDHTEGDTDGRALVVNAAFEPGIFYERTSTGLLVGSDYEVVFWLKNGSDANNPILPNVQVVVESTTGVRYETATSGPQAEGTGWIETKLRFEAQETELVIKLINNAPGGFGNDLFLDDISLRVFTECDLDGDGVPNKFDADSDGDGILDIVEAGNTANDPDGNGRDDSPVGANGIPDNSEDAGDGSGVSGPLTNTDNSPYPNPYDIDADDDGIPDNVEAQTTAGYQPPSGNDDDFDGIDNQYDPDFGGGTPLSTLTNSDGTAVNSDTIPDYLDTDSDNDGVPDIDEAGVGIFTGVDDDNDGLDDGFDVTVDPFAWDVNNDLDGGAANTDNDDLPGTPEVDFRETMDFDMDGIPDNVDLDDDNDGILDTVEEACVQLTYAADQTLTDGGMYTSEQGITITTNITEPNPGTLTNATISGAGDSFAITNNFSDLSQSNTIEYVSDLTLENVKFRFTDFDQSMGGDYGESFNITMFVGSTPVGYDVIEIGGNIRQVGNQFTAYRGGDTSNNPDNNMELLSLGAVNRIVIEYSAVAFTGGTNPSNMGSNLRVFGCDRDVDGDGIPNSFETDSDNDGCSDANEAYGDSNADGGDGGEFGTGTLTFANGGVNADGTVADAAATYPGTNDDVTTFGPDIDLDGIADACDPIDDRPDFDNDGVKDADDLDDDNDGILDTVEGPTCNAGFSYYPKYDFNGNPGGTPPLNESATPAEQGQNMIASTSPLSFGPGVTNVPQTETFVTLGNVDQRSLPGAIADGDYVEYNFTTNTNYENARLTQFSENNREQDFNGPANPNDYFDDHKIAILIATDAAFTNPEVLLSDFVIGTTTTGFSFLDLDQVYFLQQNSSYWVRVYHYDAPADTLDQAVFDDFGITAIPCNEAADFDGDGQPNSLDLDADNDGIYDVTESGGTDLDNDGFADDDDNNVDNTGSDGIPTSAGAGNTPTDSGATAGTPDYLDYDSDEDGCSDANEAYDGDVDGVQDAQFGGGDDTAPVPTQPNGTVQAAGYPATSVANPFPADVDVNNTADYQEVTNPVTDENNALPADVLTIVGSTETFTSDFSGTGLIYEWLESTNGGTSFTPLVNGGVYSGVDTATLTLTNIPFTFNGNLYKVTVSGGSACDTDIMSREALLTVQSYFVQIVPFMDGMENNAGATSPIQYEVYLSTDAAGTMPVNNTTGGDLTFDLTYPAGSTAVAADYGTLPTTVTIPNGQGDSATGNEVVFDVAVNNDDFVEGTETLIIGIANPPAAANIGDIYTATGNIIDADVTGTTLNIEVVQNGTEDGADLVYRVFLTDDQGVEITNETGVAITADVAFAGTATGPDFTTAFPTGITIPSGTGETTITLPVTDDLLIETDDPATAGIYDETLTATLSNIMGGNGTETLGTNTITGSVIDNDDIIVITLSNTQGGAEGTTLNPVAVGDEVAVVYDVTLTNPGGMVLTNATGAPITTEVADAGTGSAVAADFLTPGDIPAPGGTVISIANTTSSTSITLDVNEDGIAEGTETLDLQQTGVFTGTNLTISGNTNVVTGSISDNDDDDLRVRIELVRNGSEGPLTTMGDEVSVRFAINLYNGDSTAAMTPLAVINGTGSNIDVELTFTVTSAENADVTQDISTTITGTIVQGTSGFIFDLDVVDDFNIENLETVDVTIASIAFTGTPTDPTEALDIDTVLNTAQGEITDNDNNIEFLVVVTPNDGSEGPTTDPGDEVNLEYTVTLIDQATNATLTNTTGMDIVADISFGAGSTAEQADFVTMFPTEITFPNNSSDGSVTLVVLDDDIIEETETLIFQADSNPANATNLNIDGGSATGNVLDNDAATISIEATIPTGDETGPVDGEFTVTLRDGNGDPIVSSTPTTVTFTVGGTASNDGTDYTEIMTFTITIPAGSSSAVIPIEVNDDDEVEGAMNETVIVTLGTITAGDPQITVDTTPATVDIIDNDTAPVVVIAMPTETIPEDTTLTFTGAGGNGLSITDGDGQTQTVTINVTNGTLDLTDVPGLVVTGDGSGSITITGGSLTDINTALEGAVFTPTPDFEGTATIIIDTVDASGNQDTSTDGTNNNTVTITVQGAPDAVDDEFTTLEDTPVMGDIFVDNGGNGPDDIGTGPTTVVNNTQPANGTAVVNSDGTFTYTPDANFFGTDTFEYTIRDSNGQTSTATVTVNVTPTPDAVDDTAVTDEDTPVDIDVIGNDDIGSGPTTVTSVTDPMNGTVTINGDGTVTYIPDPDTNGTDTFTYTITDDNGNTSTATVTVSVTPTPDAEDDTAVTDEDTPVDIDVIGNDDIGSGPTTVTSVTDPMNGTVTINGDGTVTYIPDPDTNGTDTFTYTITDDNGNTSTATVTVSVTPTPDAEDDTAVTDEDTPVDIDVIGNDDIGSGPTTVTSVTDPMNGTVTINGDGTVTYIPDPDTNGTDTFTYTITDDNGNTSTATVTVNVTPTPDAEDDTAVTDEDTPVDIDVIGNDDIGSGPTTVTSVTDPMNGTVTI
ncbi:tandem-95 repeat protein, partial [Dokdonia sinensis]